MIFIKFEEALLLTEKEKVIISLEEISRRRDLSEILHSFYCPDENCNARLTYNRRTRGAYLSKHKSATHSSECLLFSEEIKRQKEMAEYEEVKGRVSEGGLKRRKRDTSQMIRNFLNPPEKIEKKPKKRRPTPRTKVDEDTVQQITTKVIYDSDSDVIKKEGEGKVREPSFYKIYLHQLSKTDNWKNITTCAYIDNVSVGTLEKPYAEISGYFEDQKVVFVLPEAFFVSNKRALSIQQLLEHLKALKGYIKNNSGNLLIGTLCQSKEIQLDNLLLYIPEPDFMKFVTKTGSEFPSLSDLAVAIASERI